jgi:hypothetical protein
MYSIVQVAGARPPRRSRATNAEWSDRTMDRSFNLNSDSLDPQLIGLKSMASQRNPVPASGDAQLE